MISLKLLAYAWTLLFAHLVRLNVLSLNSKAWQSTDDVLEQDHFPETPYLSSRPNTAIGFSGGGTPHFWLSKGTEKDFAVKFCVSQLNPCYMFSIIPPCAPPKIFDCAVSIVTMTDKFLSNIASVVVKYYLHISATILKIIPVIIVFHRVDGRYCHRSQD